MRNLPAADESTAYARFLLRDDALTEETPLPRAFHERFPSHFVGQRTADGIWPEHSPDVEARERYRDGQAALYDDKDPVAAIRAYEAALEIDPTYLHAWVALGIAYVMDNTQESLGQAEGIFSRLCALESSDWLSREAASILRQNLGYVYVARYRRDGDPAHLIQADTEYRRADALAEQMRIELLCPWAFVAYELGNLSAAKSCWMRACQAAPSPAALAEYAAKYAPLRAFPIPSPGESR